MRSQLKRLPDTSSRILDAYVAELRTEVARLSSIRDHSHDTLWLAQLDQQIDLKLQLIDDVCYCQGEDDVEDSNDEPAMRTDRDSRFVLPSVRPSIS